MGRNEVSVYLTSMFPCTVIIICCLLVQVPADIFHVKKIKTKTDQYLTLSERYLAASRDNTFYFPLNDRSVYPLYETDGFLVSSYRIQLCLYYRLCKGTQKLSGTVNITQCLFLFVFHTLYCYQTATTYILFCAVDIRSELADPDIQGDFAWLFWQSAPTPWWFAAR